jgi:hypothetical protein
MPKIIVPINKLPYPGPNGKHKVRFRITTKDYNEVSEWSPIFILDSILQQSAGSASYTYNISNTTFGTKTITISWDDIMPITDIENHDIFVDWDQSGKYEFFKRNSGNSIVVNIKPGSTYIKVKVQVPSYPLPPQESPIYLLFETLDIPV